MFEALLQQSNTSAHGILGAKAAACNSSPTRLATERPLQHSFPRAGKSLEHTDERKLARRDTLRLLRSSGAPRRRAPIIQN